MRIYLIQHGEARTKEEDEERSLTEKGRLDAAATGQFLSQAGVRVPEIWHSEKARARQTAEITAQSLGTPQLLGKRGLAPLDPVEPVRDELTSREQDLMLVGHLPFLSRLADLLLSCRKEGGVIAFQQGGVVCLQISREGMWEVILALPPRLLE